MDSGLIANAAFGTNNDGHCSDRKATAGGTQKKPAPPCFRGAFIETALCPLSQGRLWLLLGRNRAWSARIRGMLGQVGVYFIAGDGYGVRIAAVVTNLAIGLGSGGLPWSLRNQNKD